ncbi:MAG: hypothetical protein Q8Q59_08385 [Luteolibacter sp.]|jgi:hypothetical protein|nr:hypothetical protein [Luteolibacter sp.]
MIAKPPFYLHGQEGKALGNEGYSFEVSGVQGAELKLRSLDADELTFSMRAKAGRIIPADEQWLTLKDDDGRPLFTGICKRSFSFVDRLYGFTVSSAYQGLMETPLLEGDRAFVLYPEQDLGERLLSILNRGIAAGLPLQAPATMPGLYLVPKQAFRSQSIASALEDALKWAPDCVTRMDYSTTPPTLRFITRSEADEMVIDLDSDSHKATGVRLTPYPEARALSVSFAYARRDGDDVVLYLVQTAGDDSAEANRKLSLYLSGQERSDMLVTEALTTAQKAVAMAQASVDAVGASIDAAAASAQISITWSNLLARDSNLQAAVAAQPSFTMSPAGGSRTLYTTIGCGGGSPGTTTTSYSGAGVSLKTSGGAAATGWYPIVTGAFTPAELATAGATKETRYLRGWLLADTTGGSAGETALEAAAPGDTVDIAGWSQAYTPNCGDTSLYFERYLWYECDIAVDAINMAPSAVAAAVKAAAASGSSAFIERAEFVEAPPDLAVNYFARQDWTPYKGILDFTPSAPAVPLPGDFVSVRGEGVEEGWRQMKAPVAETSIDLETLSPKVTVGPSPRMNFSSLVDRLRIPQEDNYEPG